MQINISQVGLCHPIPNPIGQENSSYIHKNRFIHTFTALKYIKNNKKKKIM